MNNPCDRCEDAICGLFDMPKEESCEKYMAYLMHKKHLDGFKAIKGMTNCKVEVISEVIAKSPEKDLKLLIQEFQ